MRNITDIKEIQKIALDILIYFDKICKENGLKYFIVDGTLLGAVRHSGFIPWDDDIDVWMPRTDYEKLDKIVEKNNEDKYAFCTPQNTKNFIYPFGKLIDTRTGLVDETCRAFEIGVHIDVFPYDGMPGECEKDYEKYAKRCIFLAEQRYPALTTWKVAKKRKNKGKFYFLKWLFRKVIGINNWVRLIDWYSKKYPVEGAKYISSLASEYKFHQIMESSIADNLIDLQFENHYFRAPRDYDKYLTKMYGDYMTLPPKDQRIPHERKAWWK